MLSVGPVPRALVHCALLAVLCFALITARAAPELYERYMQEDRFIEWLSALTFLAAGVLRLRAIRSQPRWFDLLVGIFCLFVAGEEISWGQRLLGYTPSAWFLEHNFQQETTLHNFSGVFGRPKWSLITVLVGFGLLLPAAASTRTGTKILGRIGATPPARQFAPWFALSAVLLIWYPLQYTGEWVELMSAVLFFATASASGSGLLSMLLPIGAVALTIASGARSAGTASTECARNEAEALLQDIRNGAGSIDLLAGGDYEKRMWTAVTDKLVSRSTLAGFDAVKCDASLSKNRRRYLVDPWGTSYWIGVTPDSAGMALVRITSFGPDRRRNAPNGQPGDDIEAYGRVDPFSEE